MSEAPAHSELYFTDARDHWWYADHAALVARVSGLSEARAVLEVGAGQGHFARLWGPLLPEGFDFVGVEPEARSRGIAQTRSDDFLREKGLRGRYTFVDGRAEKLPFEEGRFDAVVCQTLLIHLADPAAAVREMVRVLRPGGVLLVVEPNNTAQAAQQLCAYGPRTEPVELLTQLLLQARCIRGKASLGLGWNDLGTHLPRFFEGLERVSFRQVDRPWVLTPPYASAQERAALEDLRRDVSTKTFGWPREEALRYYLADGGDAERFERDYDDALRLQEEQLAAVERGEWCYLNASTMFIGIGYKPGGLAA